MYLYVEEDGERILVHIYLHSKQGGGRGEQDMLREVKKRLRSGTPDSLRLFGEEEEEDDDALEDF